MNEHLQKLSMAGRQAVQARNWSLVRDCAREILNRQRNSAEGRFLLGLVEKAERRNEQASAAFARALEIDGDRYDAAVELATQYVRQHRYGEAAELLGRYRQHMDNSPLYLDKAGTLYCNIGLPGRALSLYRKADSLQPGVDAIRANLAACCVFTGEIDEARAIYTQLLDKNPRHQRNHYELSRLGRATDDTHVEQMKAVLRDTRQPPRNNVYLYYAIGKELEDLERWDEAFDYYKMGGDAAASVSEYDVQSDVDLIDCVIATCDESWLAEGHLAAGEVDTQPIFIVGLPRTGTTLTERIISSHSQVESAGESFFIQIVLKHVSGIRTADGMNAAIIEAAANKDMQRIADDYRNAIDYRLTGKPWFIEKFPENFLYLGFIARAFPEARLISVNRHPMDSCFALYKQSYFRYAYTLHDLARYYRAYHRLRDHWRTTLGDRFVEVEYEDLVSNHEAETRRLLQRIGLDFDPACLSFEKNRAASNTASTVQIREKAHTRSVQRWKCYQKQLQSLQHDLESAGIDVS